MKHHGQTTSEMTSIVMTLLGVSRSARVGHGVAIMPVARVVAGAR